MKAGDMDDKNVIVPRPQSRRPGTDQDAETLRTVTALTLAAKLE